MNNQTKDPAHMAIRSPVRFNTVAILATTSLRVLGRRRQRLASKRDRSGSGYLDGCHVSKLEREQLDGRQ